MTEMIERVARAMCEADPLGRGYRGDWRAYITSARAAIGAMRELTDSMFIAGVACMAVFHDYPEGDMSFPMLWEQIIDEALK